MLNASWRKTTTKQVEKDIKHHSHLAVTGHDWYFDYVSNPKPELLLMMNTWCDNCSSVCINTIPDV